MKSNSICEDDLQKIRDIPLDEVFSKLGMDVVRNRVRCFKPENHAHGDRDRSISISRDNRWKCWVCDADGGTHSTIDLVMETQNLNFREACLWLGSNWGINLKEVDNEDALRIGKKLIKTTYKPRELQPIRFEGLSYAKSGCCKIYQDFFDHCTPPDEELKEWWLKRGFTLDLLYKCDIRRVEGSTWRFMEKTYNDAILVESGLKTAKNGQIRHIFGGAYSVVFPFFNGSAESAHGGDRELLGFKVRNIGKTTLPDGRKLPKYLAPIGWSIPIYCFDDLWAWREFPTRPEAIYLTESETDALAMQEIFKIHNKEGYCVALPSASKNLDSVIVRELIEFVSKTDRNTKLVVVADDDKPGMHFYHTIGQAAYNAGIETYLYQPHKKYGLKDLNDYLIKLRKTISMKYSGTDTSASNQRVINDNNIFNKTTK